MSAGRLAMVASLAFAAVPVSAQPVRAFSISTLKAAQAAGRPVLVDVFAPWCPTCRAQAPTIDGLARDPAYKNLVILRLDYDHQIAEKKALGIAAQSTIIAYKGSKEVGRVVGVTDPAELRALASSTLP